MDGEAIEGKKILCFFEARPSFAEDQTSKRKTSTITGNPAVAVLKQIWKYKK